MQEMLVDIFWIRRMMMLPGRQSLASPLMVLLIVIMEGDALRCVRCMSITNARCEYGDIPPVNCSLNEKYCIQYVGDSKHGKVFFRDCSTEDMKSECVYKLLTNETVLACYSTCQTDGCNHAEHVLASETCIIFTCILGWLIIGMNVGIKRWVNLPLLKSKVPTWRILRSRPLFDLLTANERTSLS